MFSGSAHLGLAEEICAHLGVPLRKVRLTRFANDCLEVQLQSNCRERDVFLIQPLCAPVQEHLVELLLMLDAARGASAARVRDPALRLRPVGQEGHATGVDRRPDGR